MSKRLDLTITYIQDHIRIVALAHARIYRMYVCVLRTLIIIRQHSDHYSLDNGTGQSHTKQMMLCMYSGPAWHPGWDAGYMISTVNTGQGQTI